MGPQDRYALKVRAAKPLKHESSGHKDSCLRVFWAQRPSYARSLDYFRPKGAGFRGFRV